METYIISVYVAESPLRGFYGKNSGRSLWRSWTSLDPKEFPCDGVIIPNAPVLNDRFYASTVETVGHYHV